MPRKLVYAERINLFLATEQRERLQAALRPGEREVEAIREAIELFLRARLDLRILEGSKP